MHFLCRKDGDAKQQIKRVLNVIRAGVSATAQSWFPLCITWLVHVGEIFSRAEISIWSLISQPQPVKHLLISTGTAAIL